MLCIQELEVKKWGFGVYVFRVSVLKVSRFGLLLGDFENESFRKWGTLI